MTLRSFIVGLLLLVTIAYLITFNDYQYANVSLSYGNHLPMVVVFLMILFSVFINPVIRLIHQAWVFSQKEVLVIWCMVAAGVGIPAYGLLRLMLPFMVAPFYYGSADSKWAKFFYDYVPDWLVPSKDPNSPIVRMFYEGVRDKRIPYEAWIIPFFTWGIMIMGFFLMIFCFTAIIRKQWVEHERLSFPLAQVPLEITREPEPGRFFNALFRSPILWVGALLPIAFWTLYGVQKFVPWFPYIDNVSWPLTSLFGQFTGWRGLVILYFMPIGVAFLLSTEVSLSLWLFFVLANLQRILRNRMGYSGGEDFEVKQQVGGYVMFAALVLWTMRHHLRDVLRKAFTGAKDVDDSQEGLPYRVAVIGFLGGGGVVAGWLCVIGCPVWAAVVFVGVACMALLVLSRLIAQCGLLLVQMSVPSGPLSIVQDFVGDKALGPGGLTGITFHQSAFYGDQREVMMPTLVNNTKVGEKRLNLRKLFAAMMVSVFVAYCVSYWFQVRGYYTFGASSVSRYSYELYPKSAFDRLALSIESPKQPLNFGTTGDVSLDVSFRGIKHMTAGAVAVFIIFLLRSTFYWWFIHPLGIITAQTYPMQMLWVSIFIGWLCKAIAQRYARGPMMEKVKQLFIGLIVGDAIVAMFWSVCGLILGKGLSIPTFPG